MGIGILGAGGPVPSSRRTSPHRLRDLSLTAGALLGAAAAVALGTGVDAAAYDAVQRIRSCPLEAVVAPLAGALEVSVACALTVLLWSVRGRRWEVALQMGVVAIGGALACEWMKLLFDRPRPSALPTLLWGYSFPSGHAFNTIVLWGAVISALGRGGAPAVVRRAAAVGAALAIAAVITHRLYVGKHWLTDIIASGLLAGLWLFWAPDIASRLFSPLRPLCVVAALALPFVAIHASGLRIPLPAANRVPLAPLLMIDLGEPSARGFLRGAWSEDMREPAGTLKWILGKEAALTLPLDRRSYLLRFVARPVGEPGTTTCQEMELRVNGTRLRRQLMYKGWREYQAELPEHLVRTGQNLLTIRMERSRPGAPPHPDGRSAAFLFVSVEANKSRAGCRDVVTPRGSARRQTP